MVERAGESDPAGAGRDVKSRVAGTSLFVLRDLATFSYSRRHTADLPYYHLS